MPRPHKKRKTGDDSSDEDEWKPSSHSVLKAVRALSGIRVGPHAMLLDVLNAHHSRHSLRSYAS